MALTDKEVGMIMGLRECLLPIKAAAVTLAGRDMDLLTADGLMCMAIDELMKKREQMVDGEEVFLDEEYLNLEGAERQKIEGENEERRDRIDELRRVMAESLVVRYVQRRNDGLLQLMIVLEDDPYYKSDYHAIPPGK